MKCLLLYYTGTFNTRYVTTELKKKLLREGFQVDTYEIDPLNNERLDWTGYDILGLGYPIYGYCAPWPFLKFIRKQKFPKGLKAFIYKNSGETEHANDASSKYFLRKLRRDGVKVTNEYHFIMPYNIHFRFDERLVKEMLGMDDKLLEILVYEIKNGIPNRKRYKLWPRLVSTVVSRPQYIGGDINSFFYKVDKEKCINCDLCIKRCPTKNIYRDGEDTIRFHHHCLMCMRCSLYCPKDAIYIGFLEEWGWKVNGGYDFGKISQIQLEKPFITKDTKGFFKCYIETYEYINNRYDEIFTDTSRKEDSE